MKKLYTLFFAIMANAGILFADGIKIGDLYYTLDPITETAKVTYKSYNPSINSLDITTVVVPNSILYNDTWYVVTSIGDRAFYGCSGLNSIVIPNSVTSIGNYAFYECISLTSIEIPNSVTSIGEKAFLDCSGLTGELQIPNSVTSIGYSAFSNCSNLTSVVIPNSVTSIEGGTFQYCSNLTSVVIPNSVTSIGSSAFGKCSSLTSIEIPNSVTSIGEKAFLDCSGLTGELQIPNSVTSIGYSAFSNCSNLTSVVIPNSVTSIGNQAFANCSNLTSVVIPNSVTSIGSSAFGKCSSLTSIEIPNSVTSIGSSAFSSCTGLNSIVIPNSVTSIGSSAFHNCSGLTSVTIGNSVTSIGNSAFWGCHISTIRYNGTMEQWCMKSWSERVSSHPYNLYINDTLTINAEIPSSVTSIGDWTFCNCESLTSVTIPNSVTSIGSDAFGSCSNLTSVSLPNTIKTIGNWAFGNCHKLTAIDIPDSVTTIANCAFGNCHSLKSLIIPPSVQKIDRDPFYFCTNLIIYVPVTTSISDSYCFSDCKKVVYYTDRMNDCWFFNDSLLIGYSGKDKNAYLPTTHNGNPYAIDSCAFFATPITSVYVPEAVTEIKGYAFKYNRTLKKVSLAASITNIDTDAFLGCDSIESVAMGLHAETPSIKKIFSSSITRSLKEFIVLEGSTLVGTDIHGNNYQMFRANRILESVEIASSVQSIANCTFMNCINLKSLFLGCNSKENSSFANAPRNIKQSPNFDDSTLNYGLQLQDSSFMNCINIKHIQWAGVTEVGYRAFKGCTNLQEVRIPNTVKVIRDEAFMDCTSIQELVIPNSISQRIGTQAFYNCSQLTNVTLNCDFHWFEGKGTTGGSQFDECNNITHIQLIQSRENEVETSKHMPPLTLIFNNSLQSITQLTWLDGSDTINWTNATDTAGMKDMPMLQSISIPEGLTGIGNGVCKGATLLTKIDLPTTLTSIGTGAFMHSGITGTFTLPKGIRTIGECVLAKCSKLHWLKIGCVPMTIIPYYFCGGCENLERVDYLYYGRSENKCQPKLMAQAAFADCVSLRKVTIPSSVEEIQGQAYSNCTSVNQLYVEATTPPICHSNPGNPFFGIRRNHTLVVPEGTATSYANSVYVWNEFNNVMAFHHHNEILQSTETTTETTTNSVNVSWVENNNAGSYGLNIQEKGSDDQYSFSVASYNPQDMPVPSPMRYAKREEGISGISFLLTGLDSNTEYDYSIITYDIDGNILEEQNGSFRTEEIPIEPTYYTIRFLNYDSTELQSSQVLEGEMPVYNGAAPVRPEDENYTYTFNGWDPTIVTATANADYTAQYTATAIPQPTYYTIRFLNYDGTELQSSQVLEGEMPVYNGAAPVRPEDENYTYTFNGWNPTIVTATANADYTAQYTATAIPQPTYYTIRFLNWNGAVLQTVQVLEGEMPVYNGAAPVRADDENYTYTFNGWDPTIVTATANADYTAQYTATAIPQPTYYTIRFLNYDGTELQSSQVLEGEMPVYNGAAPVRPEDENYTYTFNGWDPTIVTATANADYTAQYTATAKPVITEYSCGDNLTWEVNGTTLVISGTGAMWNYAPADYEKAAPWGTDITSVSLPNGLTAIGSYAFAGSKITSITIPETVTSIGYAAFATCSKLKEIAIPASISSIGDWVFENCTRLSRITVNQNNGYYCDIDGVLFTKDETALIQYPIGNSLKAYSIPFGVTSIQSTAFEFCKLTSVVIPATVASIADYTFYGATMIKQITCEAATPPSLGSMVFEMMNLPVIKLFVQAESTSLYSTMNTWKNFNIQPIQAEEAEVTELKAEATENSVVIEWSAVAEAETYCILIKQGGETICTLTFNAEGQLLTFSLAAPVRTRKAYQSSQALPTTTGWKYTVSGLDSNTEYTYTVIATRSDKSEVYNETIPFKTTGAVTTGIDDQITNDQSPVTNKVIKDDQIYILRGDKTYTITGQEVR